MAEIDVIVVGAGNAALAAAPALPVTFPDLPLANQLEQMAKLLSVREALMVFANLYSCPDPQERVATLLTQLDLESISERLVAPG